MIEKISEKQFKELKNDYVVVDFYANWCGPCKMISPFISEISEEIPLVAFKKIDVDENEDLASALNIKSIPTIIIFKYGEEIDRKIGFASKTVLKSWILDKTVYIKK
ncbi:MAG: thioredoxin [Bacilli bacterium]|nr:thioredoxin [Bacilli bacterium]